MVKDSFTGEEMSPHKGVHLLKNDGTVEFYGSSKSRKNALKLGRDKRKLKWTEAHAIARARTYAQAARVAAVEQTKVEQKAEQSKTSKK